MSKLTLLDATQKILSSLEFDPVNSITDTVESEQVAEELKTSYFTLMSQRDWPFLCGKNYFEGLGDTNNPTKMRMPETINKVKWVRYNDLKVDWLDPEFFQEMLDQRKGTTNADANGYITNKQPEYWTTFDDSYVYFDSYDSSVDTTLQQSKCVIFAVNVPSWSHTDEFTPTMPQKMFYTWLADAKSACFVNYKQTENTREERRAKLGRTIMQQESWRNEKGESRFNRKVNYGRK